MHPHSRLDFDTVQLTQEIRELVGEHFVRESPLAKVALCAAEALAELEQRVERLERYSTAPVEVPELFDQEEAQ